MFLDKSLEFATEQDFHTADAYGANPIPLGTAAAQGTSTAFGAAQVGGNKAADVGIGEQIAVYARVTEVFDAHITSVEIQIVGVDSAANANPVVLCSRKFLAADVQKLGFLPMPPLGPGVKKAYLNCYVDQVNDGQASATGKITVGLVPQGADSKPGNFANVA